MGEEKKQRSREEIQDQLGGTWETAPDERDVAYVQAELLLDLRDTLNAQTELLEKLVEQPRGTFRLPPQPPLPAYAIGDDRCLLCEGRHDVGAPCPSTKIT